jgi:hypothetical protein
MHGLRRADGTHVDGDGDEARTICCHGDRREAADKGLGASPSCCDPHTGGGWHVASVCRRPWLRTTFGSSQMRLRHPLQAALARAGPHRMRASVLSPVLGNPRSTTGLFGSSLCLATPGPPTGPTCPLRTKRRSDAATFDPLFGICRHYQIFRRLLCWWVGFGVSSAPEYTHTRSHGVCVAVEPVRL